MNEYDERHPRRLGADESVVRRDFYEVVHSRRDVRSGFRPDLPVSDAVLTRVLEAADRGMWAKPDDGVLDRLRRTYLELEGDLEGQA